MGAENYAGGRWVQSTDRADLTWTSYSVNITSEGKVYDENWNEYNIVPGNISSNYTMVNLGFDGSNQFAESATKLAGIYSSALSKDDCIKAYNYLQTLKAK
jgi:hypothetical protein